jgi:hypothetical protein
MLYLQMVSTMHLLHILRFRIAEHLPNSSALLVGRDQLLSWRSREAQPYRKHLRCSSGREPDFLICQSWERDRPALGRLYEPIQHRH